MERINHKKLLEELLTKVVLQNNFDYKNDILNCYWKYDLLYFKARGPIQGNTLNIYFENTFLPICQVFQSDFLHP